jgi:hypothetical protein
LFTLGLVASGVFATPAVAGPNRCGTSGPPNRSPTWTDATGSHWFDRHGLWTQGPDGSVFGNGGIDFDRANAQVDLWTNHSAQAYVSPARQCAIAGDLGVAPNIGEFQVTATPAIVQMPWLSRDGNLFKSSDRRTIILRGVDYPYNQEFFEPPYNLTDADFARIASWGMNLLRIRISGYRSGYLPNHSSEPGYWEHLDHIIAGANRHGIYVLLATVTDDVEEMMVSTQAYERLKFLPGSPNHDWWISFERKMFARYKNWPGVVGFDTINEDDSYPPYIHDRVFMGPAHEAIDAALRARDPRHVYFQEPSGWDYWGAEYWPGMMNGVDIGDPNRFFCPKWKVGSNSSMDLELFGQLAQQSSVPMFVCETWVNENGNDQATLLTQQRGAETAMDARLIGGVRTTYPYGNGYGMLNPDGTEQFWIREFARPYPEWVGGRIQSIHYDFDQRRLVTGLALDGSGPTELYASPDRTYPEGFAATSSTGARLVYAGSQVVQAVGMSWDAAQQRVVLPPHTGSISVTIAPRA